MEDQLDEVTRSDGTIVLAVVETEIIVTFSRRRWKGVEGNMET